MKVKILVLLCVVMVIGAAEGRYRGLPAGSGSGTGGHTNAG